MHYLDLRKRKVWEYSWILQMSLWWRIFRYFLFKSRGYSISRFVCTFRYWSNIIFSAATSERLLIFPVKIHLTKTLPVVCQSVGHATKDIFYILICKDFVIFYPTSHPPLFLFSFLFFNDHILLYQFTQFNHFIVRPWISMLRFLWILL